MRDRSKLLNCDVRQMCKSMLLENKQWRGTDEFDPANARFYLVVVQYAATFDAGRLRSALVERTKLPAKAFNFRVADGADNVPRMEPPPPPPQGPLRISGASVQGPKSPSRSCGSSRQPALTRGALH